ncbi:MAG: glycosyltransferase [Gaiellaceae bacterium]
MPLPRLLMLVPHEPDLDPRVGWAIGLCREMARTDVIAATWNSTKPSVEYDGVVSVERIDYTQYASRRAKAIARVAAQLDRLGPARRFAARQGRPPARAAGLARVDHHLGAALRLFAAWGFYGLLISALYQRGRAVSMPPTVIVSHDIYGLMPAVLLKRRFGAKLLHDSHEFFPEADLLAPAWQRRLTRIVERVFIRRADRVITVSPQIARIMEREYGLCEVSTVPNAGPRVDGLPAPPDSPDGPLKFLLQGQASAGRGFEQLLTAWEDVADPRAVLQVRCPDGAYPQELRLRFASLFDSPLAEWLDAVPEDELVAAASRADVGVSPYVGPSLNHLYASPNKLSQYMAAGLAVLACRDMNYVNGVIREYDCGVEYDADDSDSLRRAIDDLARDPERLHQRRMNAQVAAALSYNWEVVSGPYREALAALVR